MWNIKLLIIMLLGCVDTSFSYFSFLSHISQKISDFYDHNACHLNLGCCERSWNKQDFSDLYVALQSNVFGQNIMTDIVVPALQSHLLPDSPKTKALAISFHGRPGIGKNYAANIIQEKIFNKKSKNPNVHFYSGRHHFPLESEVTVYKKQLAEDVKKYVHRCEYSLFIFDEVDKMPPSVLDAIKPFLDHHDQIDGIDFRRSTFIFISNVGGKWIGNKYIEYWKNGKKRNELKLSDFEDFVRIAAFNERGGFYRSETIESSLIDHYVPFLPLEEIHVRKCISSEFVKRSYSSSEDLIREVLKDITFGPEETPIFSNGGCKRIASKVAALVYRSHFRNRNEF